MQYFVLFYISYNLIYIGKFWTIREDGYDYSSVQIDAHVCLLLQQSWLETIVYWVLPV